MSTSMNSAVKASIVRKNEVQNKALASVVKHFKRKHRALVTMACGSGKTRVCFMTISSMKAAVSVIAVPTLGLVRQMQDDAVRWMPGEKFDKLLVCSTIRHGDVSESPEDYGLDVTTSPEVILEAISKASKKNRLLIVVTYQSFDKLAAAATLAKKRRKNIEIGLLVADEAHNTAGDSGKKMALCLSDRSVKINKRLFLTATRKVIVQNTKNPQNYNCMDDERVYGKNVFDLSFAQAIKLGITCDYEILNMEVNWKGDDAKKLNTKNYQKSQGRVEELARFLAREMKKNPGMRVFSFHTSVANAEAFNKALLKYKVWSRCITGEMPLTERQAILDEFESSGGSRVICSVRVFGEGVDVPSVDTVVFTDPLTSPIQIAQMVGRGQRVEAGKDMLSVYLPVFHPNGTDDETAEKTAKCSYFKTALKVLRTMSDMDDRLVGEIKNGWNESKKEGNGRARRIVNQSGMSAGFASVVKSMFISKIAPWEPKSRQDLIDAFRVVSADRISCKSRIVVKNRTAEAWASWVTKTSGWGVSWPEFCDEAWPESVGFIPESMSNLIDEFRNASSVRVVKRSSVLICGRTVNSWAQWIRDNSGWEISWFDFCNKVWPKTAILIPQSKDDLAIAFRRASKVPLYSSSRVLICGRTVSAWSKWITGKNGLGITWEEFRDYVWPENRNMSVVSKDELVALFRKASITRMRLRDSSVIGGFSVRYWAHWISESSMWGITWSEFADEVWPESAILLPKSKNELIAVFRKASNDRLHCMSDLKVAGRTVRTWANWVSSVSGWGITWSKFADEVWPESSEFKPSSIKEAISRLRKNHKRRPSFGEAPCGLTADRWEAIAKRLNTTVEVIMKRAWPDS